MFDKYTINYDYPTNLFQELATSINFEHITKGRTGANLVNYQNNLVPIVRTTTAYTEPSQKFLSIHHEIIENIKKTSGIENLELNNALIEIYDSDYKKMGFHSDQALDLADNSYICLFSCYENPNLPATRKLVVQQKLNEAQNELQNELNNELLSEVRDKLHDKLHYKLHESLSNQTNILLDHNSVVIFSTETNKKYNHKIIMEDYVGDNRWLGITFRLSKTFIKFNLIEPYLTSSDKKLRFADQNEVKQFRQYKGLENKKINYSYPNDIDYTISLGDLLLIE